MNGEASSFAAANPKLGVSRAVAVVRLGRPVFLLGGIVLYALGTLAAFRSGHAFDLRAFVLGQLAVSSIQLMTHYANDYFDYDADCANRTPTRWSGGSRVLVNGDLPREVALRASLLVGSVAPIALLGIALSERSFGGELFILIGLMQVLAWSYSAPPFRLHSRGLGELTTALVVPMGMLLTGFLVQSGRLAWLPIALAIPLALLQIVMLLSIEIPDRAGDERVGKRTLVVRLGPVRAVRVAVVLIALAFASVAAAVARGALPSSVAWAWLALAPLALLHAARLLRVDVRSPASRNALAFGAVAFFFLAAVAEFVALV
jgi:1,4-dihydroxy-2-naphthoate octaprenyltransferase